MIAPFFAELATSFKGKMVFLKVDVDANEVRDCAHVQAHRTLLHYQDLMLTGQAKLSSTRSHRRLVSYAAQQERSSDASLL